MTELPLADPPEERHTAAPAGRWCPYCGADLSHIPDRSDHTDEAMFSAAGRRLKVTLAVLFVVIWLAISIYDWFDDPAVVLVPGWYSALGAVMLFYLLGFNPLGMIRRR